MHLGFHVSIAGGLPKAVDRATQILRPALGPEAFKPELCTYSEKKVQPTLQLFMRNPREWRCRRLGEREAQAFSQRLGADGYTVAVAHMPYLPNLASPVRRVHSASARLLRQELERCGRLGLQYLVAHLGSHLGRGREAGVERVVAACRKALSSVENGVTLLLENSAGTRNSVGSSFDEMERILGSLGDESRLGVCLDTCHAFAAGYDLRAEEAVGEALSRFDNVIGLGRLKVIHLNDTRGALGSGVDRHEHIGLGGIGEDGFRALLHREEIEGLPLIMETPADGRRDDRGNLQKVLQLIDPDA